RHAQLEQQLQALNAQRDALESQKQQHMTSLEACNAAVSAIQQRLQELRTTVVECTSHIEQHESQFALKTRWIEELKQQATQLELEDAQLRARVAQFDEQLARVGGGESELQTQLGAIQEQANQGSGELTTLEAAIQHALGALATAKGQLFEAATDASHQRNQLTDSTAKLQSLEAHLARVEEQRAQHTRHAEDITQRHEAACHEREGLQTQWDEAQHRVITTQQTLEAAGATRHELTGRLHQLRDQIASERAQVTLLEGLWHRYEGFPDTIKALMGHGIEGLIGPLVDLVQAVPGYEDVVESALGPLAEAIVVRDRNALARCRQTLTAQQLEGCRFLVLSDCPQAPAEMEQAMVAEGVSGPVKQFIRAEAQYQPLVDWLLNDSWVIDDLQRLLGEQPIPQHRLVSAKGDRWDRRSWRFSGTRAASHSRIGRKQRWERAQTSLKSLEQTFATLDAQVKDAEQQWQSLLG
ncbi:MAG TPA: hypothetical protein VJB16_00400, partial [archaeon]|nr:hypothetical protein [archaeon]